MEFYFPDSVTKIGTYVLSNCENLKKVTFGKGISTISEYTFQESTNITELVIPSNVTKIDSYALGSLFSSQPTIYGEKGSEAANFASKKGLAFKLIEN